MRLSPYREPAPREEARDPSAPMAVRPLGALRSHHGVTLYKPWVAPAAGIALYLFFGTGMKGDPLAAVIALVGGGLLVLSPLVALIRARARGVVDLHAGGVVVRTLRRRVEVLFDEVDALWFDITRDVPVHVGGLRLTRYDGSQAYVPVALKDGQQLFDAIQRACSMRLVPEAEAALAEGETLDFACVKLSARGLHQAACLVRWEDIASMRFVDMALELQGPNVPLAACPVPLRDVPHPQVFMHLVQKLAGRRALGVVES